MLRRTRAREAYEEAAAAAYSISGPRIGAPHGSGWGSIVEHAAERVETALARYAAAIDDYMAARKAAAPMIDALDVLAGVVIERRYAMGQSWAEISQKMGKSASHLQRIHRQALTSMTAAAPTCCNSGQDRPWGNGPAL